MTRTSVDPELHEVARAEALEQLRSGPPATLAPSFDLADLYGPLGDYVRLVAPHTEASPAALYACGLAACGILTGRGPTWFFGGTEHHARHFVLLIGPTGAGRKGTAISLGARQLLRLLDAEFLENRVTSGLSSAEGLIAEIRDPVPAKYDEASGKVIKPGDAGVTDKRLLVIEGEAAGPLQSMSREGNRLSPILRDAWDGVPLRSLVKHDPQRATTPHFGLIAAITAGEFRKLLTETAATNGLANRLLPIWAMRSQFQSRDTAPDPAAMHAVVRRIHDGITAARAIGRVQWTPAAQDRWDTEYVRLAQPDAASDTVRALLERGAPHVMRLAMTLALLDGVAGVGVAHLEASLALWRYIAGTWAFVYHDAAARSPMAAKLLTALEAAGADGLTRTAIRDDVVRSGSVPADAITSALAELERAGLAVRDDERTGGRPRERWRHARWIGATVANGVKGENADRAHQTGGFDPISHMSTSLPRGSVRVRLRNGAEIVLPADSRDITDNAHAIESITPIPEGAAA